MAYRVDHEHAAGILLPCVILILAHEEVPLLRARLSAALAAPSRAINVMVERVQNRKELILPRNV